MSPLKILIGFLACATAIAVSAESPIDSSKWKTYRNEAMRFEVKYPDTWHIRLITGTMESVLISKPEEVGKPNVSVQFAIQRNMNPKGMAISEWKAEMMKIQKIQPTQFPTADTVVGGKPALRSELESSFGRNFTFFTSINRTDIFQIMVTQPSSETKLDKTYKSIISTVKFLN